MTHIKTTLFIHVVGRDTEDILMKDVMMSAVPTTGCTMNLSGIGLPHAVAIEEISFCDTGTSVDITLRSHLIDPEGPISEADVFQRYEDNGWVPCMEEIT